jgi:DNA anti-recombination protein RmuC
MEHSRVFEPLKYSHVDESVEESQTVKFQSDLQTSSSEEEGSFLENITAKLKKNRKKTRQNIQESHKKLKDSFHSELSKMKEQFAADIEGIKKDVSKMQPG